MKSVMRHDFSQVPNVKIPRSVFNRSHGHKTTMDAGQLVPIYVDEALPGDTFNMHATVFARLLTPIAPIMDNLFLDTFYFAVPARLLWDNWEDFITGGDHVIPVVEVQNALKTSMDIYDYFGVPIFSTGSAEINALPFRAYNLIFNEWFRHQDLKSPATFNTDDGPDFHGDYEILNRMKRHDYFTSCMLTPQKGQPVQISLGTDAPVWGTGNGLLLTDNNTDLYSHYIGGGTMGVTNETVDKTYGTAISASVPTQVNRVLGVPTQADAVGRDSGLIVNLSEANSATINELREAFQLQKMLEKDMRGGTRYIENILSNFGVKSSDARMQRPEYLGGSSQRIQITPVPQTSETGTTEQGWLGAFGTVVDDKARFNKSFDEHCYIIGLANVRADLTYQQGLHRMFSRQTRYDFYWPTLANLGEQEVLSKEIYFKNVPADDDVFGYQERYAEYRYHPSRISGKFRSEDPFSLDLWHLSQEFSIRPGLSGDFMKDDPPMARVLASADEPHLKFDSYFDLKCTRCMPVYSIPGYIDHM